MFKGFKNYNAYILLFLKFKIDFLFTLTSNFNVKIPIKQYNYFNCFTNVRNTKFIVFVCLFF